MTGNGTVLDFCGSFPDGDGIGDLTARIFEDVSSAFFLVREITIRQPHVELRKEVAEKAGLGFKLPPQNVDVGPKGPKWTETPDVQLAVSA